MSMSPVTLRAVIKAGIVFVYLLAIGTVLYGAAIPAYQTAASERLADRVLSDSVRAINDVTIETPPTDTVQVDEQTSQRVGLPDTIDGRPYRVYVDGAMLRLDHPNPAIERAVPLPVPRTVDRVEGGWTSTEAAAIEITMTESGRDTVRLVTRSEGTQSHRSDLP